MQAINFPLQRQDTMTAQVLICVAIGHWPVAATNIAHCTMGGGGGGGGGVRDVVKQSLPYKIRTSPGLLWASL